MEKQISFLEKHEEYYAVAHNCIVVGEDSKPNGETYPECKDEEYTYRHFFSGILPGQLSTVMYRNYYLDPLFHNDYPPTPKGTPGDQVVYYKLIVNGRIYCMQDVMSAYRHIVNTGYSYSANWKYNFTKIEKWQYAMLEYTEKYKPEWKVYVKERYLGNLLYARIKKLCNHREFVTYFRKGRLSNAIFPFFKWWIKKHIFKTRFWV